MKKAKILFSPEEIDFIRGQFEGSYFRIGDLINEIEKSLKEDPETVNIESLKQELKESKEKYKILERVNNKFFKARRSLNTYE